MVNDFTTLVTVAPSPMFSVPFGRPVVQSSGSQMLVFVCLMVPVKALQLPVIRTRLTVFVGLMVSVPLTGVMV